MWAATSLPRTIPIRVAACRPPRKRLPILATPVAQALPRGAVYGTLRCAVLYTAANCRMTSVVIPRTLRNGAQYPVEVYLVPCGTVHSTLTPRYIVYEYHAPQ